MTKKKEKPVLMDFGKIRLVDDNEYNVQIQQKTKTSWKSLGFYPSINAALKGMVIRELLVDYSKVKDLPSYVKAVKASNEQIKEVIENRKAI